MRRLAISLLLGLLASFLLNVPVFADPPAIKLNIINNSGYPDSQVYLVFYAQAYSDGGGTVRRLDWQTGNFTIISANDNSLYDVNGTPFSQYGANPDSYANYSTTLSALPRDANGQRYFNLPTTTFSPAGFAAGRLYISFQRPVYLYIYGPTSCSQPGYSFTSLDVNAVLQTKFDFFEPALDTDFKVWADTTNVDAIGMPLLYELKSGTTSLGTKGMARPMSQLRSAFLSDPVLKALVTPAMIIAPGHGIENSLFPSNYLDNYIAYAWPVWTQTNQLTINYDTVNWTGYVSNNQLALQGNVNTESGTVSETHYVNYPATIDVFECNNTLTGDISLININYDPSTKLDAYNRDCDLKNMVGSALNRAVFHLNPYPPGHENDNFPWYAYLPPVGYNGMIFYGQNGVPAGQFATNVYSKLLHQLCYDGLNIYGFAYDDNCGLSSTLSGYADTIKLTIGNYLQTSITPVYLLLLEEEPPLAKR